MFSYADGSTLFRGTSRPILTRCQENVYCSGICKSCKITFVVSYKFCFIYIIYTDFLLIDLLNTVTNKSKLTNRVFL